MSRHDWAMSRHCPRSLLARGSILLAALSFASHAAAQSYESRYGATAEVSLNDLLQMPEAYVDKAVRTKGQLDMYGEVRGVGFALRGTFGGRLRIQTMPEVSQEWETQARGWIGGEVEVTGLFEIGTDPNSGGRAPYIAIWAFLGPPDEKPAARGPVAETTLEELVTRAGRFDGKTVRVRGQFRGQNLFGDLPSASRRRSSDWVIKDELYAVWVTGKKPKGRGWELDAGLKRDSTKWLEVTGRVATSGVVVTIEASEVALSKPPTPAAQALPPPPPPPKPKKPPQVVFSLPLDGERGVAPNTVFRVQFSNDMDERSFAGRVLLRYAGRTQPGDRELDAVKFDYDGGRRTLAIDPGDLLRAGRIVEVVLLPGIVDLDGVALQPRPGVDAGRTAIDVLRFQTAATSGPSVLAR